MIEDSSCRIKYKRPHDSDNGHRDNTWEKEYRTVKGFFPKLTLGENKGKDQTKKNGHSRDHQHQLKGVKQCLEKILVLKHVNIIIKEYEFAVKANAECSRACKG